MLKKNKADHNSSPHCLSNARLLSSVAEFRVRNEFHELTWSGFAASKAVEYRWRNPAYLHLGENKNYICILSMSFASKKFSTHK